jgi:hypothetical protein
MAANGNAIECEHAIAINGSKQREIARATTDITDHDLLPQRQLLLPGVTVLGKPSIERGLWLFQQRQPSKTRSTAGLDSERSSRFIERGWYGQDDLLLRQRCVTTATMGMIPRFADVTQQSFGSYDRRNPRRTG